MSGIQLAKVPVTGRTPARLQRLGHAAVQSPVPVPARSPHIRNFAAHGQLDAPTRTMPALPANFNGRKSAHCACGGSCPRCEVNSSEPDPLRANHLGDAHCGEAYTGVAVATLGIQRKPTVSSPADRFEREADKIAETVMRMAVPAPVGWRPPAIQSTCTVCEDEEKKTFRAKQASSASGEAGLDTASAVRAAAQGGAPLPGALRFFFEPRFGHAFGHVRVHTDGAAADGARAVQARAYTIGSDIVFGSGEYAPATAQGMQLLAHELVHVVQQSGSAPTASRVSLQRATGTAEAASPPGTGAGAQAPAAASSTSPVGSPNRINVDVLAAEGAEDFLIRAAAEDLGVDITVSSIEDMITQVERRAGSGTCIASLDVFNHGNPQMQAVSGGSKVKLASGEVQRRQTSGFALNWLLSDANQPAINRLRGSFCCNAEMRWYGCSTAGVTAEGGQRTAEELRGDEHRYQGYAGAFYHSLQDAAAHGATGFGYIGPVNVQSWANALCTAVTGATDFNSWTTRGSHVIRTVIHGGSEIRVTPQADVGCACDATTGRLSGAAPTGAQLRKRESQLREQALRPLYEQARSVIGRPTVPIAESEEMSTERERFEQRQTEFFQTQGELIRGSVLTRASFAAGSQPTTPEEALRVTALWNLPIDRIVAALGAPIGTLANRPRGAVAEDDMAQRQRAFEAALTPRGRQTFIQALRSVRSDRFWNDYFLNHTIYVFPDLTGTNRYRGYTQRGTHRDESGRETSVFIIHISADLLNDEHDQTALVATNLVHELTHTVHETTTLERSMESFRGYLAELLMDHPHVQALRANATDPAAARQEHLSRIRQLLYDATGYAEGEILSLLQQITHQPSMTVSGTAVSGSRFILEQVIAYVRQLGRIGMPPRMLEGIFVSIQRRTAALYDRRIAAAPEGSRARELMQLNKNAALATLSLAISDASGTP